MNFKEYILSEGVNTGGLEYELKVYNSVKNSNVKDLKVGDKPTAGFSNVGSGDLEIIYKGKPYYIEIKSSISDQMGGSSIRYDKATKTFSFAKNTKIEEDEQGIFIEAAKGQVKFIDEYIEEAKKLKPVEFHKNILGIPLTISKEAREILKNKGFSAKINKNIHFDSSFIVKHYNRKNVFYINIGNAGLFYLGKNPLNLNIPELKGDIQVEMRLGFSGSKRLFKTLPVPTEAREANLRIQGRMKTKMKSDYNLDNKDDVIKLFEEK